MTETALANAALRMLGAARVGDVSTDRTPEAECIRDVWAITADSLLRSHRWNFAKKTLALSVNADGLWVLPADCLRVLKVNGLPAGLRSGPEIFGKAIKMPADITVTAVSIDYISRPAVADWDPSFCLVFQHLLAAQIAPGLSAASSKAGELRQMAREAVLAAIEANAIETAPLVIGALGNTNAPDTWYDSWLSGPP